MIPSDSMKAAPAFNSLVNACKHVVIVAHKEDTSDLANSFRSQGFEVSEVRGPYTAVEQTYSSAFKCFVNHANAWRIAAARDLPTIVVEADFVPVKNIGRLAMPAPPDRGSACLPYLYACGPEIWDLDSHVARGHAGGLVATVIFPKVAAMLLEFFDEQIAANPTGKYTAFDAELGYWLMKRGIESYFPYRQYGEHGGIGNPEHKKAGNGRPHQADALNGSLAFMPAYAKGSKWVFRATRLRARMWGCLRLATGRYMAPHDFRRGDPMEVIRFAAGRLVFSREPQPLQPIIMSETLQAQT